MSYHYRYPVLKKGGCPKGHHEVTVVGLPAKKCKHASTIYYTTHKS